MNNNVQVFKSRTHYAMYPSSILQPKLRLTNWMSPIPVRGWPRCLSCPLRPAAPLVVWPPPALRWWAWCPGCWPAHGWPLENIVQIRCTVPSESIIRPLDFPTLLRYSLILKLIKKNRFPQQSTHNNDFGKRKQISDPLLRVMYLSSGSSCFH